MKGRKYGLLIGAVLCLQGTAWDFSGTAWGRTICRTQKFEVTQGEIGTAPSAQYRDSEGTLYELKDWELIRIPGGIDWREMEQEVLYEQVEAEDQIPSSIPFYRKVEEKEAKGRLFEADREITGEHWSPDFQVLVTFHAYGAEVYTLGDLTVEIQGELPMPGEYEEQLLKILDLSGEDYQILTIQWKGEPYEDERGVLCRDALARGNKRLRDYRVIYRGEVAWPVPDTYEMKAVYQSREASRVSLGERQSEGAEGGQDGSRQQIQEDGMPGDLILKITAVTIALGMLVLAVGLVLLGLSRWKKLKKNS